MNRDELLTKLQDIFTDVFGNENIVLCETTNPNDIEEWDSLTHISILAAIQDEFSVSFGIDEIISMKNVGDMLDAIERKM